jgi:DNA-binding response OmpR family regulator
MKILVADDDRVTRKFVSTVLHRAGHDVVETSDGRELWDAYRSEPTNLIVTDWMMPHESGVDVCRRIREQPSDAYAYVIVVTSLSGDEHTLEGFAAGADEMLIKPLDAGALAHKVGVGARMVRRLHAQAERSLRGSVEVLQEAFGPDDERLLEGVSELTELYRSQRAFVKCRAFLRRQIGIIEAAGGPDDPRLRKVRDELERLRSVADKVY